MKAHPFLVGAIAGAALGLAGFAIYTVWQANQSSWTGTEPTLEALSGAVIVGSAVWLVHEIL